MSARRRFGEYAVAGTAFVVSICSLFIYIYQAKIMAEQQQVAAWPYLEWYTNNIDGYKLVVQNKGIGPAIVRQVRMTYNGKEVKSNRALLAVVMGSEKHEIGLHNAEVNGRVMSPTESTAILTIPDAAQARQFQALFGRYRFELEVTYCSIYGRCWTTSGFRSVRAADDTSIMY